MSLELSQPNALATPTGFDLVGAAEPDSEGAFSESPGFCCELSAPEVEGDDKETVLFALVADFPGRRIFIGRGALGRE